MVYTVNESRAKKFSILNVLAVSTTDRTTQPSFQEFSTVHIDVRQTEGHVV